MGVRRGALWTRGAFLLLGHGSGSCEVRTGEAPPGGEAVFRSAIRSRRASRRGESKQRRREAARKAGGSVPQGSRGRANRGPGHGMPAGGMGRKRQGSDEAGPERSSGQCGLRLSRGTIPKYPEPAQRNRGARGLCSGMAGCGGPGTTIQVSMMSMPFSLKRFAHWSMIMSWL